MTTTIVAWVENKTGVLARIAGIFSARGLNIESLNVAPTADPTLSQLTIVLDEPEEIVEQVVKLINRVIDVVKVANVTRQPHIERELVLIVAALPHTGRHALIERVRRMGATVIDMHRDNAVLEAFGTQEQIQQLIDLLGAQNVRELVRTGRVVLPRTNGAMRNGLARKPPRRVPAPVAEALTGVGGETPA